MGIKQFLFCKLTTFWELEITLTAHRQKHFVDANILDSILDCVTGYSAGLLKNTCMAISIISNSLIMKPYKHLNYKDTCCVLLNTINYNYMSEIDICIESVSIKLWMRLF